MAKSKEYRTSIVLSGVGLVLLCVALVTGLMSGVNPLIEKICFFLGISLNCLGFVTWQGSKEYTDNEK